MMRYGFAHGGNWFCGPGAFFPGPLGWVITLIFWILVLYLIYRLLRILFQKKNGPDSSPLETLKKRYARGEINDEEFKRMKSELL